MLGATRCFNAKKGRRYQLWCRNQLGYPIYNKKNNILIIIMVTGILLMPPCNGLKS
ncbi:hypothetical protein HPTD01_2109 [Halomonas sp. TD01]|nr:hypothetical protein HPTD01_2109 [Halomonas sp. TD01]